MERCAYLNCFSAFECDNRCLLGAEWDAVICFVKFFISFTMTKWTEQRYCIKFCQKLGESQSKAIRKIQQVFRDYAIEVTQIKEYFNGFKNGHISGKTSAKQNQGDANSVLWYLWNFAPRVCTRRVNSDRRVLSTSSPLTPWCSLAQKDKTFGRQKTGSCIMTMLQHIHRTWSRLSSWNMQFQSFTNLLTLQIQLLATSGCFQNWRYIERILFWEYIRNIAERHGGDEHHSKRSLPEVFSAVAGSMG